MGCGPTDRGSNPRRGVMVYDAALPLSHRFEPDGGYSLQCRARLDATLRHYRQGLFDHIIVTGGYADLELPFTHATALKTYLVNRGVPKKAILAEELALDTIGQAFFSKFQIVKPRRLQHLLVVTHLYHGPRTRTFFNFVYHDTASIDYLLVQPELTNTELVEHEQSSLAAFKTMFVDIKPGDDKAILERLLEAHPYYSQPTVVREIRETLRLH